MKSKQGFTLIELMIVVAIVAIISAIAYPGYVSQSQKTKRSDAMIMLTNAASMQERSLTKTGTYLTAEASLNAFGTKSENGAYNFSAILAGDAEDDRKITYTLSGGTTTFTKTLTCTGARCYILAAVATGGQSKDESCAVFTLDSIGRKQSYDSAGNLNSIGTCWK